MFNLTLTKSGDTTDIVNQAIQRAQKVDVLVGIPQKTSSRPGSGEVTNAELMYIHTNGSPLQNIPARPVIEPAIEASPTKEMIADEFRQALDAVLLGDESGMMNFFNRAGSVAATASQEWFFDPRNGWPPNSPLTIRLKGSSQPLVDTGEMRRSITFLVEEK